MPKVNCVSKRKKVGRKCCLELNKCIKLMKEELKKFKGNPKFFILLMTYRGILYEQRERNRSWIIGCLICSRPYYAEELLITSIFKKQIGVEMSYSVKQDFQQYLIEKYKRNNI